MNKEGKKAVKQYIKCLKKFNYEDENAIKEMLRNMTNDDIEPAIRPFQEKFIKLKISNIASKLYKDASFDSLLYVVKEFNAIRLMTTDNEKSLDDLYALVSQFFTKFKYAINNSIIGPSGKLEESEFYNFKPVLNILDVEDNEFASLFGFKSNGKLYTGIIGSAMKQNRKDLVMKILKNIILPYYENYNNTIDLILDSGYTYGNSILTSEDNFKNILAFVEEFDIKFNIEKELYFDCFGRIMASMCLPVKKKEDYELNKDRIKEEFTRPSNKEDKYYSELFYEVLYRNFSKKEKTDLIDTYIQNTIRKIKKTKDEEEKEDMLIDMCLYHTESINVVSDMWDTFKQYLFNSEMYPFNYNKNYDNIFKAFLYKKPLEEKKKFENFFFSPLEFVIEGMDKDYAVFGFLQTLKKNECTLILNDIFNNIVKPMKQDNNDVVEWFRLNGYSL